MREQGRIKNIPTEIFYFLLTSGGTAPFGQIGLVSLMAPKLASPDDNQVRLYAENVADMLLNGLSLPEINRGFWERIKELRCNRIPNSQEATDFHERGSGSECDRAADPD